MAKNSNPGKDDDEKVPRRALPPGKQETVRRKDATGYASNKDSGHWVVRDSATGQYKSLKAKPDDQEPKNRKSGKKKQ